MLYPEQGTLLSILGFKGVEKALATLLGLWNRVLLVCVVNVNLPLRLLPLPYSSSLRAPQPIPHQTLRPDIFSDQMDDEIVRQSTSIEDNNEVLRDRGNSKIGIAYTCWAYIFSKCSLQMAGNFFAVFETLV